MSAGDAFGLVGTLFAEHYEIIECVAEGRTGLIYAALEQRTGRDVALKVLRPALCENKDVVDAFLAEAEVASAIRHAAVVEILEVGATANGWVFVAMERIAGGEDMATYLRHTGPLPWSRVRPLAIQLCHAVDAGHRQGVVHRYLTTARCLRMVDRRRRERIKLLGFGVAGILPGGERSVASAPYAAPEQLAAAAIDRRVDVFAVGAIIYELLTARKLPVLRLRVDRPELELDLSAVRSGVIREVLAKALHPDRERRFVEMGALADALNAIDELEDSDDGESLAAESLPGAATPAPDDRPLRRGDFVGGGRFQLVRRLALGGATAVWLAIDNQRRERAAVRVLHDEFARLPDRVARFEQVVARMQSLEHPGVVPIVCPAAEEGGHRFFAADFVEGWDLREAQRVGRLAPAQTPAVLTAIGAALTHAHERGVLHEDLRPTTVLIDAEGRVRLVDFGLARVADTTGGLRTGAAWTFPFLAPEVRREAAAASVRADVFSLGVLAVFMICGGDWPVPGDPVATIGWLRLPPPLKQLLRKATAPEPSDRYRDVASMCRVLTDICESIDIDWEAVAREPVDPRARQMLRDAEGEALLELPREPELGAARPEPSASMSGPGVVFVSGEDSGFLDPAAESAHGIPVPKGLFDEHDYAAGLGVGEREALQRAGTQRAQLRIVLTLAVAVICSLAALTMVLTMRALEVETGELVGRMGQCEPAPAPDR